ncbi:MAG: CDGSH iron-sulfur domain-containing protein [Magnetospirillum sp.]|nr:CDGSH iron-sulfur domain-containing protein [Magnetospirillum sp.]
MSEPEVATPYPMPVEVKAGEKVFWCTCGRSASQPTCDGAHKGSGKGPLLHVAVEDGTLYLCGCKRTATPPFCDGAHNAL